MRLYDIASEYRAALDGGVDPETGEVTDDLELLLDTLGGELEAKVDAIAKLRAEALADAAAFKAEADRCTSRRKAADARAERLRDYLGACLAVMGETKVKTSVHTVALVQNPPHVVIIDESRLPDGFIVWPVPTSRPNKAAIKEALEAGAEELEGIAELERATSVRVR